MLFYKDYSLSFLAKNDGAENCDFIKPIALLYWPKMLRQKLLFHQAYSLTFSTKMGGAKKCFFIKPIALLFQLKLVVP